MPITFNCPCGKVLSSRERDAGLKAICPNCGRRVVVPGQVQVPVPQEEQLRTAALKLDRWIHSNQRGIMVATILVGIVVAAGLIGYKLWNDAQMMPASVAPQVAPTPLDTVTLNPNADPDLWQSNFDSFAVALKQAIGKNALLESQFKGKQIEWEVTYEEVLERYALYFREAKSLGDKDRGIYVVGNLLPSQVEKAEKLQRGERIILRGIIGPIFSGRSAEHPLGYTSVRPIECTIEPVKK